MNLSQLCTSYKNKTQISFVLLFFQGCLFSEQPKKMQYLPLEHQSTSKLTGHYKSYRFSKLRDSPCNTPHYESDVTRPSLHCPGGHRIQGTNTNPNSPAIVTIVNNKQSSVSDTGPSYFLPISVAAYLIVLQVC